MLEIVGRCDKRLFGLAPPERLRRQMLCHGDRLLVAHADVVMSDETISWLLENPGTILTTPAGRPAAVAVDPEHKDQALAAIQGCGTLRTVEPSQLCDVFIRKLRRRSRLLVRSIEEQPCAAVERDLFAAVYKGVTDVVTKYVWPLPALWVTRLCAGAGIRPNAVTLVGMLTMLLAAYLWLHGELVAGLALAWLMTFLDTVDGKLARVTVTSSRLGNKLDHLTDVIHPPIWWVCLATGIDELLWPAARDDLLIGCAIILVTYVAGRVIESRFKKTIGYNAYLWQPFDSWFRLIVARRNTILAIMTIGIAVDEAFEAFMIAAGWSVISVTVQFVRFIQARQAMRSGNARSWLM